MYVCVAVCLFVRVTVIADASVLHSNTDVTDNVGTFNF